jgi:iron complex outermembrane receptor protein
VFLQDLIALSDNLKLLGGIRYDAVWQDSTFLFLQDLTENSQFTDAFSTRLGIVYQPIEEVSLYGSYSQSFFPNSATNVAGDITHYL